MSDQRGTWITEYDSVDTTVEHLDGVSWSEAPLPRRWHRCRAQTQGWTNGTPVRRCACGAMDIDGLGWGEKNARRRDKDGTGNCTGTELPDLASFSSRLAAINSSGDGASLRPVIDRLRRLAGTDPPATKSASMRQEAP